MKNTQKELIITTILIIFLIALGLNLVKEKTPRFEDSGNMLEETMKQLDKDLEVKDRPCFNSEGVEVICKG